MLTNFSPLYTVNSKIAIGDAGVKGNGIFALQNIRANELIERVPVLVIPSALDYQILQVEIGNYIFEWSNNDMAIALGFGSIYNHSYSPNAYYELIYEKNSIEFIALSDILPGEEIVINYNGKPDDKSKLWFKVLP